MRLRNLKFGNHPFKANSRSKNSGAATHDTRRYTKEIIDPRNHLIVIIPMLYVFVGDGYEHD
jgi:hypothetical protein